MKVYLELVRPVNVALGVAGVLVGAIVAAGVDLVCHLIPLLWGCVVVATFMSAGNALNDYTDRHIDRANHPERPIPSGRVTPRAVLALSLLLWAICIIVSLTLPFLAVLVALTAAALMLLYDLGLKRAGFAGNVVISLLVGMLFLFGGTLVGHPLPTLVLFLLASLATLAREVVKDIQDVAGDADRQTLPRAIGIPRARSVAAVLVIAAVALSPLPVALDLLGWPYVPPVIAADATFIYSLARLGEPARSSWLLKAAMGLGLVAFIAGGVA